MWKFEFRPLDDGSTRRIRPTPRTVDKSDLPGLSQQLRDLLDIDRADVVHVRLPQLCLITAGPDWQRVRRPKPIKLSYMWRLTQTEIPAEQQPKLAGSARLVAALCRIGELN